MRKITLYIAQSLNGKIAKSDGSVAWLESIPNPDKNDYGYSKFYDSVDTTIQGYTSYKQVIDWGIDFPYAGKKNFVLTRKSNLKSTEHVEFITENPIEFIKQLKNKRGGEIWLIGGGQINTLLLNENLIDEIHVFIMPIVLDGGIEIFEGLPMETKLKVLDSKIYSNGVSEILYKVIHD
ncbi:MAG: dihydrofolate reductase [Salinivirgaceae bacterium]|nr:dihydrofolate reductase [Salinivirgaceae bacterium]